MVSITVHLNFDYALFSIFCPLWQALIENGARSQLNQSVLSWTWGEIGILNQLRSAVECFRRGDPLSADGWQRLDR